MSKKVVFCNCQSKIIEESRLEAIAGYLHQVGHPFAEISDLCGCTVDRKAETHDLLLSADQVLILACYPRAIKLLLDHCGIDHQYLNFSYLNFRESDNTQLFEAIDSFFADDVQKKDVNQLKNPSAWPSWYPMIDYSRCNTCGQCADFCLFGVYEKIDNKIEVVNPKGCKNNCPACGRICPATAIVFPKYEHDGAIAGADTIDEMAEHKRQSMDIETILGSNIYKALEMRKAKRRSIISSASIQKALEEREKARSEKGSNQ